MIYYIKYLIFNFMTERIIITIITITIIIRVNKMNVIVKLEQIVPRMDYVI